MIGIAPQEWKTDLPEFCEKTRDFYAGKMDKGLYKGFSGRYGSYAQKGGAASMLRLRMTAGCVSKEKLAFIAKAIRAYQVNMVHFTTCESVQFHNLDEKSVCELMGAGTRCRDRDDGRRRGFSAKCDVFSAFRRGRGRIFRRYAVGEGGGRISDDLYQCGKDAAQAQGLFL